jgi:hypothetical protein
MEGAKAGGGVRVLLSGVGASAAARGMVLHTSAGCHRSETWASLWHGRHATSAAAGRHQPRLGTCPRAERHPGARVHCVPPRSPFVIPTPSTPPLPRYIFETQLVKTLVYKFLPTPAYRNDVLACLTEVGSLDIGTIYESLNGEIGAAYDSHFEARCRCSRRPDLPSHTPAGSNAAQTLLTQKVSPSPPRLRPPC